MIKVLSITWSYESDYDYTNTFLYRSFVRHNDKNNFINIHFNRNLYLDLEKQFKDRFGYQYEYILYKIFLLKLKLKEINSKYIIYADTTDVACLGSIEDLYTKESKFLNNIIFSSEIHQYPSETLWNTYPEENKKAQTFLNSGLFVTSVSHIETLIAKCIDQILPLEYKNFGGDQGIYTYSYIHQNLNKNIVLDQNSEFFLSTYLRSVNCFDYNNNRIIDKNNNNTPLFIHDNGWNYGSPKFIEKFNLIGRI
jgi:hypothetical protein